MPKIIRRYKFRLIAILFCVATIIVSGPIAGDVVFAKRTCTGYWAAGAERPYKRPAPKRKNDPIMDYAPVNISSPDGRFIVTGADLDLMFTANGKRTLLDIPMFNEPLMEVLWSPDSRSFAVTVSDGGLVGTFETHVYQIDANGKPVYRNILRAVRPIAKKLLRCEPGDMPNIGVSAWLKGSREVLIVVEVPPHSSCRNMGDIGGFIVDVKSKKVGKRISERELRSKWAKFLGCRFEKARK